MQLPVDGRLDEIAEALQADGAVVLSAEPGAGKTTRVPPRILSLLEGSGQAGEVIVVQPRRIAARMAARRVAQEQGQKVGETVGYAVRFDRQVGPKTRLLFVTEGVLLRRLSSRQGLRGVGAVVFDELHERHLQSDLALALCQQERQARVDKGAAPLWLVAMSATLDAAPVAAFLGARHLHVEGRTHPVDIAFAPDDKAPLEKQVSRAVSRMLEEEADGDVLVFLPGAAEIRRAASQCAPLCKRRGAELAVLHGDLGADAQDKVVRPGSSRKVILSTNLAESSVTLPSVTAVVDSGLARIASHSPFTGLPTLAVRKVSQASAIQRAGRAGRVRPGRALRLFSEQDFRRRPAHETPEIARLDLAELVLVLRAHGFDPATFPYFEAPPRSAREAAEALLERLDALTENDGQVQLTEIGRTLLRLPLHPRLGRIAIEGQRRATGHRASVIAALLAERPLRRGGRSDMSAAADVLVDLEELERADAEKLRGHEIRSRGLDEGVVHSVRRASRSIQRTLKTGPIGRALHEEEEDLRAAITTGFPDRIGRLDDRRVVFAEGGSGQLDDGSVVREGPFVVALSVQDRTERGGRGRTVIRSACEVEAELILELFEDRIESRDEVRFNTGTERVECISALLYEGLVLDEGTSDGDPTQISRCLAEAVMNAGLGRFFDADDLETFRRRVAFAKGHGLSIGAVDDTTIAAALEDVCAHRRSFRDLKGASLISALEGRLGAEVAHLHRLAPTHIALPRRKRVPVQYEVDRPPWVASRLQDFFGLKEGPRAGNEPLVLHLLAPNRRAVQVTTDLAGFWERHYPTLRKQLMRRYPRHDWREDPLG